MFPVAQVRVASIEVGRGSKYNLKIELVGDMWKLACGDWETRKKVPYPHNPDSFKQLREPHL